MDIIQVFTLSLGSSLFGMGWILTAGNWANWRSSPPPSKNHEETLLILGRNGRRLHMSIALMGLGAAVAFGAFLGRERITAIYWYGVIALALWMSLLAIMDGSATWSYVIRVRRRLERQREAILSEAAERARAAAEANEQGAADQVSVNRGT